jgi:hypothetical protein
MRLPGWRTAEIWLTAYFPACEALPARVDAFARFIVRWIVANPALTSARLV